MQGVKTRPIDDCTLSKVNAAVSMYESINPADIDHIAANCRARADALVAGSQHRSPSSPSANFQRHSDLAGASLVGRLWDIANAYRHLPLWASQHELAVVAVWNPATHGVDLFQQLCMPFGTSASVVSRNWVAFGFNLLLTQLFRVDSTNFDDDFTVGEASCLAESASKVADGMFDSLGWPLKPLPGFAEEPAPLGAVLDLREAICGEIIAKNRPERVAELVTDITEFTESPEVSLTRLLKLRGRISFSRSLCFGRCAASALKAGNACCAAADACGQTRAGAARWGSLCRDAAAREGAEGCPASFVEGELSFASNHLDRCGTRLPVASLALQSVARCSTRMQASTSSSAWPSPQGLPSLHASQRE